MQQYGILAYPPKLGTLSGSDNGAAYAINDLGQVAGYNGASGANTRPTVWSGTTPTPLNTLPNVNYYMPTGINDSGKVVGYTSIDDSFRALFWTGANPSPVPLLATPFSLAYGVNNSGVMVGTSGSDGGKTQTTIWNGTTPTILGKAADGPVSVGYAINNDGEVAGYIYNGTDSRATVWKGSTFTELKPLAGYQDSIALGINDRGQVVGDSFGSSGGIAATIWDGINPIELKSPSGTTSSALDINDFGLIVGYTNIDGQSEAAMWRAVPEPSTWAMLLIGFAAIGFAGYRKRQKQPLPPLTALT